MLSSPYLSWSNDIAAIIFYFLLKFARAVCTVAKSISKNVFMISGTLNLNTVSFSTFWPCLKCPSDALSGFDFRVLFISNSLSFLSAFEPDENLGRRWQFFHIRDGLKKDQCKKVMWPTVNFRSYQICILPITYPFLILHLRTHLL